MSHNSCDSQQTAVLWVSVSDFKQLDNIWKITLILFFFSTWKYFIRISKADRNLWYFKNISRIDQRPRSLKKTPQFCIWKSVNTEHFFFLNCRKVSFHLTARTLVIETLNASESGNTIRYNFYIKNIFSL